MTDATLIITKKISAAIIAELAWHSFGANSPSVQEILLQSKSEQTFSGLLAQQLQAVKEFNLGQRDNRSSGVTLLEYKGVDYEKIYRLKVKVSRNFHDIAVVNHDGEIEIIIENKFWYHFDGSKGVKKPKPEAGITEQLNGDIFKIKQSLSSSLPAKRGFVLINVVTPSSPNLLPKSYVGHHQKLWARSNFNLASYRQEGLAGVKSIVDTFKEQSLIDEAIFSSPLVPGRGFLDIICAEVKL